MYVVCSMGDSIKYITISKDFKPSNLICHRIPERTFRIKGRYLPVCARCTGFYIGAFSYFIYAYFMYVEYSIYMILVALLMVTPAFLDGITQLISIRQSKNSLRFITGLIGGLGLAILVKALKCYIIMS